MITLHYIHLALPGCSACFSGMAVEERLKQLERWKERKALEKEKEKREKERKGVFKVGLYHHTDTRATVVSAAPKRAKEVSKDLTVDLLLM